MEQISLNLEQKMAEQALKVVETNEKNLQNSHEQSHRLITYKRQGSSLPIYVSDLYLQQRVKNIIDEDDIVPLDQQVSQHEEQTRLNKRRHRTRYFQTSLNEDKIRQVRCYRCGVHGHTMKYCQAENQDNKCMFCLGQHNHNNCNTKSCFLCNQTGHIAKQCKVPRVRCTKCGNKGHSQQECGVIVFLNSTGIRFDKKFREQYGMEDLMKIRCLAQCKFPVGHFNCHQYEDIRQKFYSQTHIQKAIVRENYILSNVSKLRETYFKAQIAKESRKSKQKTDRIEVSNQTIIKQDDGMKMATQS